MKARLGCPQETTPRIHLLSPPTAVWAVGFYYKSNKSYSRVLNCACGGGRNDSDMIRFAFQERSGGSMENGGDQNRSMKAAEGGRQGSERSREHGLGWVRWGGGEVASVTREE